MSSALVPVPSTVAPFSLLQDGIAHSIPERFRYIAAHFPERPALKSGSRVYTYRMYDDCTDRIAGSLAAVVRPPAPTVALLFPLGDVASPLAILGVLKAGGCYVGLHPAFPLEQNQAIWTDSQAVLLITDRQHVAQAQQITQGQQPVLVLDDLLRTPGLPSPALTIAPDQVAGVFYTSGSTGRPKGMEQTHRQGLYRAWIDAHVTTFGPHDRIVLSQFIGYTLSSTCLFGALLNGAAVHPHDLSHLPVPALLDFLAREAISIFWPPITLFRQIVRHVTSPVALPQLRLLVLGGDVLLPADVEAFRQYFPPSCTLVHRFSTSETGAITQMPLGHQTPVATLRVPTGYPVHGCEVLLWDDDHQPVPQGEVGQIVIRSRYLSPGYRGNPELTRQVFLPDPEGGDRRLYLSGDLGRFLPDGTLEHLGRRDQMVKIRGHRVEPLAVEQALRQVAPGHEVVVVAREREPGTQEIVAFLVSPHGAAITPTTLRRALATHVPDYMLPSRFVHLAHWPLTSSGKIDRQALGRMTLPTSEPPGMSGAPGDALERQLIGLWETVLKVQPIGMHDNFFDLGGHSLAAIALMTQIARVTGKTLPLTALFHGPTVAHLAALVREDRPGGLQSTTVVPLQPFGRYPPLFVVPELETSALRLVRLTRYMGAEFPVYGLHPRGFDEALPPHTSIADAATYYLQALRAVRPTGPYLLAGLCHGGIVALDMARQLVAQGEEVPLLALIDVTDITPWHLALSAQVHSWLRRSYQHGYRWQGYVRERFCGRLRQWLGPETDEVSGARPAVARPTRRLRYAQSIAALHYRALPYPGPVSILWSEEYHQPSVLAHWSQVVPRHLATEAVSGTTHQQLLSEATSFQAVAAWLTVCIARAVPAAGLPSSVVPTR